MRREAVLEGVLDEGLHDERRDEAAHRARLERVAHREPVAEPHLLDREVLLHEKELRLERQLGLGGRVEGQAQQLGEAREHEVRGFRVAVDEDTDRVKRVEEEVRLELHAQRLQLGECELALERDALAVLPHVLVEDETEDDEGVRTRAPECVPDQHVLNRALGEAEAPARGGGASGGRATGRRRGSRGRTAPSVHRTERRSRAGAREGSTASDSG